MFTVRTQAAPAGPTAASCASHPSARGFPHGGVRVTRPDTGPRVRAPDL